jgi:hypothetical protein
VILFSYSFVFYLKLCRLKVSGWKGQGGLGEGEGSIQLNSLCFTSLDLLILTLKFLIFYKTSCLVEGVNSTEPSPSVCILWKGLLGKSKEIEREREVMCVCVQMSIIQRSEVSVCVYVCARVRTLAHVGEGYVNSV